MKTRLAVIASAAVVLGCGGGGSGSSSNVFRLALPADDPIGYAYGVNGNVALGSVSGSDFALGHIVTKAAYWPNTRTCKIVPNLDAKTTAEYTSAISPNGNLVGGTSFDDATSTGPRRGFVYNVQKGTFHILNLGATYAPGQVVVSSITDSGTVTGLVYNIGLPKAFIYELSTDTFTLSDPPSLSLNVTAPVGGSSPQIEAYSKNGEWAIGMCRFGSNSVATVWNVSSGLGFAVGATDLQSQGISVSNDGRTAIYQVNTPSSAFGPHVWRAGSGSSAILDLVQASGNGKDWTQAIWTTLSSDGSFVSASGLTPTAVLNPASPVLIKLR